MVDVVLRCAPQTSIKELEHRGYILAGSTSQDTYKASIPREEIAQIYQTPCRIIDYVTTPSGSNFFDTYANLSSTRSFVLDAHLKNKNISRYIEYGASHLGVPLFALYLSTNISNMIPPANSTSRTNPIVMVTSLSHAREWISGMATCYIINQLIDQMTQNNSLVDYLIVPVLNPDGFNYSHHHDRLWRKNRHTATSGAPSNGVDLDRNFPSGWGKGSIDSHQPGRLIYNGAHPLSESETMSFANNLTKPFVGRVKAFLDLQSFGQIISPCPLYTKQKDDNYDLLRNLTLRIANTMTLVNDVKYSAKGSTDLGFTMGGTLTDFMYERVGAASFTVYLRDKGENKWLLPKEQIIPTCKEAYSAIKVISHWVENENTTLVGVPLAQSRAVMFGPGWTLMICIFLLMYV
ncbi:metallocarboxypeptidase A [Acrasis kona]|uniref:Metallocarboxypeptidase A n=1 Tax=Acrasis kona TaxID=1008807 RepID=A0AAW2YSM0_9EUKA